MTRTIIGLLDKLAPQVQEAFLLSIRNVQSDVQLRVMVAALERGDVEAAINAIGLGAEYFAPLDRALTEAYTQGGDWAIDEVKAIAKKQGATITGYFAARNPASERFLAEQSSRLIVDIVADQRNMIRDVLTQNMRAGVNAQRASLDLVGRINRATGRRDGGLLGLTRNQALSVRIALAELRSGDPAVMRNYLTRGRRDRRFDGLVKRAIRDGKPVSTADASRVVGRYSDRLLKLRGETIARTELLGSLHHAKNEGYEQVIQRNNIPESAVTRKWRSAKDKDTRDTHRAASGQTRGPNGYLVGGYVMMFPGDDSQGAPAKEIILCRCDEEVYFNFGYLLR